MLISNCAEILLNKQYVISSSTPNYDHVQDFIAQLLMRNARHRLSAAQCMEHPWLMEQDIGTEVGTQQSTFIISIIYISMKAAFIYNVVITHQVISRVKLRQFQARRKWQRCQHIASHINT